MCLMSSCKGIDIWLEIGEFQAQVSTHFQVQRGFPSAPLLTRVASQNLAVGRRFPSSWGLHFSRASSKEHPSGRFNSQSKRRPFGASSYHISSVLVPCRFSDVPMRTGSPYLAELLDAMLVVYCVVA
ncbi:hypothetical protein T08_3669 [Trichinella sp. T8]|nr:hypothetical protein T08_3669 [Trichinella sp. T8]